jgi:four helix bundle protein
VGDAELARFLQIGMGSAYEVEYHLLLANDLDFLTDSDHQLQSLTIEVKKMLSGLLAKVRHSR